MEPKSRSVQFTIVYGSDYKPFKTYETAFAWLDENYNGLYCPECKIDDILFEETIVTWDREIGITKWELKDTRRLSNFEDPELFPQYWSRVKTDKLPNRGQYD